MQKGEKKIRSREVKRHGKLCMGKLWVDEYKRWRQLKEGKEDDEILNKAEHWKGKLKPEIRREKEREMR